MCQVGDLREDEQIISAKGACASPLRFVTIQTSERGVMSCTVSGVVFPDGGDVEDGIRLGQRVVAERAFVAERLGRVNGAFDEEGLPNSIQIRTFGLPVSHPVWGKHPIASRRREGILEEMNPTQKQFSLNRAAQKQIPISRIARPI